MGNVKSIYVGAYLEVVDNRKYAFDVSEIDEVLKTHDQCTTQKEGKIFWLPNITSNAEIIDDRASSN